MQILRMMICLFMINGTFVLKPIYAQEHWGKEDSIKLSKNAKWRNANIYK